MNRPVVFRREACAEFMAAAKWYETRRPMLGAEFIAEIDRCVALAAEQPERYALVLKNCARRHRGAVSIQHLFPSGEAAYCRAGSLSR